MAHMDELSMLVKRVETDGTLHMTQLGVMYPGNFGLGPVALLGDQQTLTAVLTLGSEHTTQESPRIWETKPDQGDRALDWQHVYVFTGRTPEDLAAAGVHAGTRVCVDRSKKTSSSSVAHRRSDDRAMTCRRACSTSVANDPEDVSRFHHNQETAWVALRQRHAAGLTILDVGQPMGVRDTSPAVRLWLHRRFFRLRQRRRRPADGNRHRARAVAAASDTGCIHV
jgi:hypothetical protein